MKIELKVGRKLLQISEDDAVMDNGACIQIVTQEIHNGWHSYPIMMSKKLFKDLKSVLFLYTNDELAEYAAAHYVTGVTLYKFNVDDMAKAGYKIVEE